MYVDIRKSPFEVAVEMNQEIEELRNRIDFLERVVCDQASLMNDMSTNALTQNDHLGRVLTVVERMSYR